MPLFIVSSWKETGTGAKAQEWVKSLAKEIALITQEKEIIVLPPFTALSATSEEIKQQNLPIKIGAQDISRFEEGKHTGEVSASMVAEFASYVMLGHSERRSQLGETDEIVAEKIKLAKKYNLTPIVCVSEIDQAAALKRLINDFTDLIAYEPVFAIGTGKPDTPQNANEVAEKIKTILPGAYVLYGGSVDGSNAKGFTQQKNLSGVLVGNRSLDPNFFLEILRNA